MNAEFQSYHMGPPELRPVLLKTVDCFVVDRNGNPIMRKRSKRERVQRQRTMRYFCEVADSQADGVSSSGTKGATSSR
jgi:hypothetical protein